MTGGVRLRDGIEIDLDTGETVVCDANDPGRGDVAVISHAHGDHLYTTPPSAACWSDCTRALAGVRRDADVLPDRISHLRIELFPAGHVPGSRAALIDGDRTCLYTGDVSTRDRLYMEGFDPPEADVLVVESTYGEPGYTFPPLAEERIAFEDWLAANADVPVVVFGYALGRAQEVEVLLGESDRERVFTTGAILAINDVVEAHADVAFEVERFGDSDDLGAGDALVLPSGTKRFAWVERLVDETGAKTAGFSGWAVNAGYKYANGYDETFVLSDHCDFDELVALVEAVDPDEVYTQHGSSAAFANYLTSELGYRATALRRNQTSLADF